MSNVTDTEAGIVILLLDAWHCKTASKSFLFNSSISSSFLTELSPVTNV